MKYMLSNGTWASDVKDFEDVKAELGIDEIKPKKQEQSALMKYEIKGFDVYVGRNNRQNDYIISKLAKEENAEQILVMYGIDNFATDTDIVWLK